MLTPPLPEPGEEVVQQSREAVTQKPEDRSRGCVGYLSQAVVTYPQYRQRRVLNAIDNLVNVVVGAVVDASVCAIVLFANLDVIFKANLFHLDFFSMNK